MCLIELRALLSYQDDRIWFPDRVEGPLLDQNNTCGHPGSKAGPSTGGRHHASLGISFTAVRRAATVPDIHLGFSGGASSLQPSSSARAADDTRDSTANTVAPPPSSASPPSTPANPRPALCGAHS